MKSKLVTRTSALALALLLAMPAAAQEGPAGAPQAGDPLGGEIIVTARKRNERLLDVPVAVSALSGEQLQRYATSSLESISHQTPQLIIAESQNQIGGAINLRGIGAATSNPSTEQSVTLNLDGVQVSQGNAIRMGQFDLQRVEVLKGPQALFFGKNSPGGIISLISNDPGDHLEAQVRGGYEFKAERKFVEAILSGPLTDTLGARVVGFYSKENGWFRNVGVAIPGVTPGPAARNSNFEEKFARGTLAYEAPAGDLRVKLKLNYGERSRDRIGTAAVGQLYICPLGASQAGNGITTDCKLDRYFTNVPLDPAAGALHPDFHGGIPYQDTKQFLGSLSADYDIGDYLTLSSVSGYYRIHERSFSVASFSNIPNVAASNNLINKQFTQELRLQSSYDGPFNFLLGGFYQDGKFSIVNPLVVAPAGTPLLQPITHYLQDTTAYSFFGQLRYKLTDQIELSAGGRLSREKKKLYGTTNDTPFTIVDPVKHYKDFSPELTVTYKPTTDLTLYASYREGFTSGGFNTAPATLRSPAFPTATIRDPAFDQTTVRGGEIGFKGYVFDRQLRFDVTGYYYKYKGLQLSVFDPLTVSQTTRNAAGAKVRGVEINGFLRPDTIRGLELRGSVAYNKATYTDFIGGCYPGQTIAQGCNLLPRNPALDPSTFGTTANPYTSQDQSGQPLTRAPKWSLTAGMTYDHDIGDELGASVSVDATYTSSYMPQVEANPVARQQGYWELNGALSLYGGNDRAWELALIGRNLTNRLVSVSTSSASFTGFGTGTANGRTADLFGVVNSPRSILLQLTLKSSLLER
jgi:iron complex outermembrane receptor protein